MTNFFKIILVCVSLAGAISVVSCSDKDATQPMPEYLEVNAHNISGNWKLEQWNSAPFQDGTGLYINFIRDDREFHMWQTMDSFSDIPHYVTGEFNITTDPALGAIINGKYHNDEGLWQHRYIIKDLTADQMLWVAVDNPEFTQLFVRVETIPYE